MNNRQAVESKSRNIINTGKSGNGPRADFDTGSNELKENKKMTKQEISNNSGKDNWGRFAPRNQYWNRRVRQGKARLFVTPDILWVAACKYFEWCVNNPLMEVRYVGKDARQALVPKMVPFTMRGLCLFLGVNAGYFRDLKRTASAEFGDMVLHIEETCYEQKFTGAAAGFFEANIIARDLGLMKREKIDVPRNISVEYTDPEAEYV